MVPREKDQPAVVCQCAHSRGHKPDALRSEGMRPHEVPDDFGVQRAGQLELDSHFSFAKPLRCAKSSCARVGADKFTVQEKAHQFFSPILLPVTFQFLVYGPLICTEKKSRDG